MSTVRSLQWFRREWLQGGAGGGRERERKREPAGNPRISAGSLSVFRPQIRPSVGFSRIRLDLSNPRTYTGVGSTYLAGSDRRPSRDPVARPVPADSPDPVARPVPVDRLDAVDVRLQSPAGERKKNEESFEREIDGFLLPLEWWVLKRKKQAKKKKGVTDGFKKKPSITCM
jgi:hypothetical protein